jgi:hypothetical protein
MSVQDCELVEIRRFHHNGKRNIVQAKPVAKKLALARRVSVSYFASSALLAECLVSYLRVKALRAEGPVSYLSVKVLRAEGPVSYLSIAALRAQRNCSSI